MDLDGEQIKRLLTRLDELVRWRPGAKGQYLDLHSALERIQGETNHVITGRRGSGKTRLLDELRASAEERLFRVVSIGAEDFKELTYPDILIQILRAFLDQFIKALQPDVLPLSKEWFHQIRSCIRHPLQARHKAKGAADIKSRASNLQKVLDGLLGESEELDAEYVAKCSGETKTTQGASVKASVGKVSGDGSLKSEGIEKEETTRNAKQREVKRIKVERLLVDFKRLLSDFCSHFEAKMVLAIDDFYFIRREDQPKVIDYVHRICKDTQSYLKVATIKHRTALFEHGEVARGVVPGHEIQSIDLELPLGEFDSISRFLCSIWDVVCKEIGIADSRSLFLGDGFDQAVLASGGVPRDFFGIVKEALLIARERREHGVGKRRINEAARTYAENTKLPELHIDLARDPGIIEVLLFDILRFAREVKKKNCFYIDIEPLEASHELRHLFDALADSRLIHLISDNTSSTLRTGRYAAYLLDVGLYGHPERRKERAVEEVRFWDRDKHGRLMNLSRAPIYPVRPVTDLETTLQKIRKKGTDIRTYILEPVDGQVVAVGLEEIQLLLPFVEQNNANGTIDSTVTEKS